MKVGACAFFRTLLGFDGPFGPRRSRAAALRPVAFPLFVRFCLRGHSENRAQNGFKGPPSCGWVHTKSRMRHRPMLLASERLYGKAVGCSCRWSVQTEWFQRLRGPRKAAHPRRPPGSTTLQQNHWQTWESRSLICHVTNHGSLRSCCWPRAPA